jgi:hypothetical protein
MIEEVLAMGHPVSTRLAARAVVVTVYLVVLALAGRPGWLAVLLGLALGAVFAAPFLLATNRRRAAPEGPGLPVAGRRESTTSP